MAPVAKKTAKAKTTAKKAAPKAEAAESASQLIDARIRELVGWRGETFARMRELILEADPEITEEWKWNNPVLVAQWNHLHR